MSKTLCIVEYQEQVPLIKKIYGDLGSQLSVWAPSGEAHESLTQNGVPYQDLNEAAFSELWPGINGWAKRTSISWFQSEEFQPLEINGVSVAELSNWSVGFALVHQLKLFLSVSNLLNQESFDQAIVFDNFEVQGSARMLDLRSFNYVLKCLLEAQNKPFRIMSCVSRVKEQSSYKEVLRSYLTKALAFSKPKQGKNTYLAMGAIKDLLPVLKELAKNQPVSFVDDNLQIKTRQICREHGVQYFVADALIDKDQKKHLQKEFKRVRKFVRDSLHAKIKNSSDLKFEEKTLPGVDAAISKILNQQMENRVKVSIAAKRMIEAYGSKALLLSADTGEYRGAALAAREQNCKVVVLSHGIPPVPEDADTNVPNLGVGITVVNSKFEEEKYLRYGYEPHLVKCLGLPRFDAIAKMDRLNDERQNEKEKKSYLLYCPHRLISLNRKKGYYIGIHTRGETTYSNSVEVVRAAKEAGCHLWIKTHDKSDHDLWVKFVRDEGNKDVELLPYYEKTFDYLKRCDLAITTFSTLVIEAMLFKKNIITLNFTGKPDIHAYAMRGIAYGVYDPAELTQAIQNCLHDEKTKQDLSDAQQREFEYFAGRFDGQNTQRVVDFVMADNHLSSSHKKTLVENS